MDNSKNRLNEVFFYGLYMDEEILKTKGVNPRNKKIAVANGYKLRVGKMATILRKENSKAYGIVYSLTHDEIYALYEGSGLNAYVSEAIEVECEGKTIPVLTCVLLDEPKKEDENKEYLSKLIDCMKKYNLTLPKEV